MHIQQSAGFHKMFYTSSSCLKTANRKEFKAQGGKSVSNIMSDANRDDRDLRLTEKGAQKSDGLTTY